MKTGRAEKKSIVLDRFDSFELWPRAPKPFEVYVAASLGFEPRQRFSTYENFKNDTTLPKEQ